MSDTRRGVAKLDRRTRKQARKLAISSPQLSRGLKGSLRKNFAAYSDLERHTRSALRRGNLEGKPADRIVSDICQLGRRLSRSNWAARERLDRTCSTTRTKQINGMLKTLSRLERKLLSSAFDKFPEDYLAEEAGRNLKQERLRALYALRDNLQSIKGKVGQRSELKRALAQQLKKIFVSHGVPCKKSKSYSAFEVTFQAICKHLHLRPTDNVWHFLRKL